jgi:hypothetical protein
VAIVVLVPAAMVAPRLPAPAWARAWLGLAVAADRGVVRPVLALARALARFDDRVLDRAVMSAVPATRRTAAVLARFDDLDLDGIVDRVAAGTRRLADLARRPQTGQVYQYYTQAVVVLAAAALLLLVMR